MAQCQARLRANQSVDGLRETRGDQVVQETLDLITDGLHLDPERASDGGGHVVLSLHGAEPDDRAGPCEGSGGPNGSGHR